MSDEPLYLKHNVHVEPSVDQWHAWSQLTPPPRRREMSPSVI